jgi:hypothetical protein
MFEKWEPGQAKVIDKKDITHNATGISRRYAYVVEVLPSSSGGSFRTEIKDPVGGTSIHFVSPGVGQIVAVEVDWRRQRVKLDKDAPGRMDAPGPLAGKHAQDARFAAALAGTKQGDSDASARVDMVATLRMLDAQARAEASLKSSTKPLDGKLFIRRPACRARHRSLALAATAPA